MLVQGCGHDFLACLTSVLVLRITHTHTPLRSYLPTPLRFGRDDRLGVFASLVVVIPGVTRNPFTSHSVFGSLHSLTQKERLCKIYPPKPRVSVILTLSIVRNLTFRRYGQTHEISSAHSDGIAPCRPYGNRQRTVDRIESASGRF